uniref:uncharacterized protein n=1 Tax=Pristiophorus japonicus TaxID=55135 RepID=UPI00398E8D93
MCDRGIVGLWNMVRNWCEWPIGRLFAVWCWIWSWISNRWNLKQRGYQRLHPSRGDNSKTGLSYTVESYGQGEAHEDFVNRMGNPRSVEDPGIPCVLFVYKVSRETEDLRNALQWIERDRAIKREDICAVVLLEKASNQHDKPVEVTHGGVFDEQTAVVRILWKETSQRQWFPPSLKYCGKVQEGPRYREAMDKVTESIKKRQRE